MNLLVNIKFPFNYTVGICNNGEINLCDGKSIIVSGGVTYLPNYLIETSTIHHSVNLFKGGELEECSDYVIDLVDNNLLSTLELAGYGINSGEVQVYLLDDLGTKTKLWFGYVISSELANNTLSIKCENLTKALKTLEVPVILGENRNVKLERDTSISNQSFQFVTNYTTRNKSFHPIILEAVSPKYGGSTSVYGVLRSHHATDTIIKVKYFESVFPWASGADYQAKSANYHLKLKWLTGSNSGKGILIKYVKEVVVGDHFEAWLYLQDDLQDTDIRAFDRLEVSECASYFLLPEGVDMPSNVSIVDSDTEFLFSVQNYQVTTINGKRYLLVYPSDNLYSEIPIQSSTLSSDSTISQYNAYIRPNVSLALDNDYSTTNMCGFVVASNSNHPDYIEWIIELKPDLSKYADRQLYFGMIMIAGDYYTWTKYYMQYKLKSGECYPVNSAGTDFDYSDSNSFFTNLDHDQVDIRSVPPTAIPKTNYTQNYIFNQSQMVTLLPCAVNKDIDCIRLYVHKQRTRTDVSGFGLWQLPKLGIFAKSDIGEMLDAVYIDFIGNASDNSVCGMDDRIAKEILTAKLGQVVDAGFVTSSPTDNYQHFSAKAGTTAEDALSTLAKESLSVIGSKEDKEIYRKPLVITQDDTLVDLVIPSTEIITVEPLKDIALTDFINLPKITFKDPAGNTEYFEVIHLESDFPAKEDFVNGVSSYTQFFRFSDKFISKNSSSASKVNCDNFLYWLLSGVYALCKTSYQKNAVLRSGEITFETIYLEELYDDVFMGYSQFMDIIKLNTQRRKSVSITLPLDYGTKTPLKLGQRIKLFHPSLMQNVSLYGFLQAYEVSVVNAKTTITVLVDSYKLGDGTIDFF